MRGGTLAALLAVSLAAAILPADSSAQSTLPLAPSRAAGQTVTPVFEGWYRNPDGTYSLSFGYFNRNTKEIVEIPIGAANTISPAPEEPPQPTHFEPRRHWGVFALKVPADFGDGRVVWTLEMRGQKFAIPGSLKQGWEIDALEGEAGSGNTPPVLRFAADGEEGRGPGGITGAPLTTTVGKPLTLVVWASDDGKARSSISGSGREAVPVTLTWILHQGPGDVTFSAPSPAVGADGKATTTATFAAPGEYLLRVRANDASGVVSGGHAQCCWTNGFVKVTVTR
jgi:hypothetical protein